MTIKTVVKNLIKNSSYLSYLYLKLSNKDRNFDRNVLLFGMTTYSSALFERK